MFIIIFLLTTLLSLSGEEKLIKNLNKNKVHEKSTSNSKNKKIAANAIKETNTEIYKKFNLSCIGTGAGGDYERLGLDFYYYEPLEKDKARYLALECFEIFKKNISKSVAKFSNNASPSYTPSVGITILSVDKKYNHYPDPFICVVNINNSSIEFKTDDPENEFKYKDKYSEPLEQAEAKNQEYLKKLSTEEKTSP